MALGVPAGQRPTQGSQRHPDEHQADTEREVGAGRYADVSGEQEDGYSAQRDDHPDDLGGVEWLVLEQPVRPEGGPERHQCDEQTADPAERCCRDSVKKKVGIAMLTTPRTAPSRPPADPGVSRP